MAKVQGAKSLASYPATLYSDDPALPEEDEDEEEEEEEEEEEQEEEEEEEEEEANPR
jgi:ribosomal protein L12E/L44/L45/RPP1/RPP2